MFYLFPTQWLVLLLPVVILLYQVYKKNVQFSAANNFLIAGIAFYLLHFAMDTTHLDNIDWIMNHEKRQKIVKLAKERKLDSLSARRYEIPFSLSLFPYIKSNDIEISYTKDTTLTITFFTDRGLVDGYTAFVYSNDEAELNKLDDKVRQGGYNQKKEANWYYIAY